MKARREAQRGARAGDVKQRACYEQIDLTLETLDRPLDDQHRTRTSSPCLLRFLVRLREASFASAARR